MDIYSGDSNWYFTVPYEARRKLVDSVERTHRGYKEIDEDSVVSGLGNILWGRVQSAAAFLSVALTSTVVGLPAGVILTPCFLIPTIALNWISRAPDISSSEYGQKFTEYSNDLIYRTLRVNLLAVPVIFLFLSASGANTFLPGVLKPQNRIFDAMRRFGESLGPLETIRAVVPGVTEVVGTETKFSLLSGAEEYLRALSTQAELKEIKVPSLTHHRIRFS